jgi:hypothetical protein
MATARDDLYYRDWYRWAREQAGGLRRLAEERIDTDIELERVAEDLDEMADGKLEALRSQLRRVLVHLLKLEHSPATDPRRQWRRSVREARAQVDDRLTSTLESELRAELPRIYRKARKLAAAEMSDYGEHAAASGLPADCPYAFEDILSEDWFPAPRAREAED